MKSRSMIFLASVVLTATFIQALFGSQTTNAKSLTPVFSVPEPQSFDDYMAEGKRYFFAQEWKKAAEAYKGAVAINPNSSVAQYFLALSLNCLGQYHDAELHAKEAIRLGPPSSSYYFALGLIYATSDQYEQALKPLQQSIKMKADFGDSHYWLGRVYVDGFKQYDKAILEFREAVRLDPSNAINARELGAAYYKTGQYSLALDATTISIRQDPNDAETLINLGRIDLKLARKNDAMQVYRKLQTLNPQKAQELYREINN
jgi:tetratricopeptide (TPR) repeat protein